METFHMIVLAIAAVVLILILTSIGTMMRKSNRDVAWPPTTTSCPDGWQADTANEGRCYTPADNKNYGRVAMMGSQPDNNTWGYSNTEKPSRWLSGDDWIMCGTARRFQNGLTMTPESDSHFKYFQPGDSIKIIGENLGGGKTSAVAMVASLGNINSKPTLTLTSPLPPDVSLDQDNPMKYYGKRMSIDFSKEVYTNKCAKRKWAKRNGVHWDGVSNYNKC
jgi:hypothetical protein